MGSNHRSHIDFFCGWGAGCIETCILYPSNKVIFRQQLHGFSAKQALKQIKNEGLSKLYRGLLPPLIMRTSSRAIMFGLFDEFQVMLNCPHSPPNSPLSLCHTQAAFLAGIAEASLCPLERVQVLLQTTAFHDRFKNTAQTFKDLFRLYGFREYYRGIGVILARNSLSNSLFFTLREPFKQLMVTNCKQGVLPDGAIEIIGDFFSGAFLGASISTLFFPLGLVKNHIQTKVGVPHENAFNVFRDIWVARNQSIRGIYLGVHLNFTRSLLAWGITNSIYGLLHRTFSKFN